MRVKGSEKTEGSGRKKGTKNIVPGAVQKMVLAALKNKGGIAYLEKLADDEPRSFAMLLGKCLPQVVTVNSDQPMVIIRDMTAPPKSEEVGPVITIPKLTEGDEGRTH